MPPLLAAHSGIAALSVILLAQGWACVAAADQPPRVFAVDGQTLMQVRAAVRADDERFASALAALLERADEAIDAGVFSVTDKTGIPPSGDKHDYMTIGIYWWPDPRQEGGLPYIHRDGERNPESDDETFDRQRQHRMRAAVCDLALAYYLTDHEPYAEHAARLLRVWFLDEATRMNPNMRYAQGIPGRVDGRGIGIIETANWVELVDAVGMLAGSPHWTAPQQQELQQWFREFLTWLKTSDNGRAEQRYPNNHGIWYDAQVMSYALFVDDAEAARHQIERWTLPRRLDAHFDERGRQPLELQRTLPWHYSVYNLRAWVSVAELARHVEFDLWGHSSNEGRSIPQAIGYLASYVDRMDAWPYEDIREPNVASLGGHVLPVAIRRLNDPALLDVFGKLPRQDDLARSRDRLLRPYMFEDFRDRP